jgi:hypothetical protein
MGKYDALIHHLEKQRSMYCSMSFDGMADLIGGLPPSAFEHREWWANEGEGCMYRLAPE